MATKITSTNYLAGEQCYHIRHSHNLKYHDANKEKKIL